MKILDVPHLKIKVLFIISWSLLAYSLIECIDIFTFAFRSRSIYFGLIMLVYVLFYFICVLLLNQMYRHNLSYKQCIALSIFYSLLIGLYAFIFFKLIKLTEESFNAGRYLVLLIINLIISFIAFLKK